MLRRLPMGRLRQIAKRLPSSRPPFLMLRAVPDENRALRKDLTVLDTTLSRRTFVGCSAGALALAAAGGVALGSTTKDGRPVYPTVDELDTWAANGLCTACPNLCSYAVYGKDGSIGKLIGNSSHPHAQGTLCARGYASSKMAYASDRLTAPLKADGNGDFVEVSWDEAIEAIGDAFATAAAHDPASVAAIHGVEPTAAFYAERFMAALGSANSYTDPSAVDASKLGGYAQVTGATGWDVDAAKTKMLLVLGEDPTGLTPAEIADLKTAKEAGATVVFAAPVLTGASVLATEWVPVTHGAQLALVLALCNRLIADGSYDAAFLEEHATGTEAFIEAMSPYTPQWARDVAGVPSTTVVRLASQLAAAAPAAVVVDGAQGGSGVANSGELARAVCALNTLLGCWNQPGGALLYATSVPADLGALALDAPEAAPLGADDYPLAASGVGSAAAAIESGKLAALLLVEADVVGSTSGKLADDLRKIGCVVAVDWHMSDTARCADWVLPATVTLEFAGMPAFVDAPTPVVVANDGVIDPVVAEARPVNAIVGQLAEAAGVGDAFAPSLEEFAEAQLAGAGISMGALSTAGTVALPGQGFSYGVYNLATPSGSFELTSDAAAAAGLTAAPGWIAPAMALDDDHVNVLVLSLPTQTNTASAVVPGLASMADAYAMGRVWLNSAQAAELGIADGDEVEITTIDGAKANAVALLTERVVPDVVVVPAGFSLDDASSGRGVCAAQLVSDALETGYGAPISRAASAVVKKAGA